MVFFREVPEHVMEVQYEVEATTLKKSISILFFNLYLYLYLIIKRQNFCHVFFSTSFEFLFEFGFEFLLQFGFHPYFYGCSHVFCLPAGPLLATW